jgi:DNA-directed RNA polymerase specialized sigma24 family protein
VSELAEMLGKKVNTIKSRLMRGRELLRARLQKGGYGCEKNG